MKIDKEQFEAGLKDINPGIVLLPASRRETFLTFLRVSGVPEELCVFLADAIPSKHVRFRSGGYIYEDNSIMEANEEYKKMIEAGYLQVGHAPNGDQIVIDFRHDGRAGYISHDEFYEGDEDNGMNVEEMFIPVADSIGKMVLGLARDQDFPIDIFDAEEKGYANQTLHSDG